MNARISPLGDRLTLFPSNITRIMPLTKELFHNAFDVKRRQLRQELQEEVALASISNIEASVESLVRNIYGI